MLRNLKIIEDIIGAQGTIEKLVEELVNAPQRFAIKIEDIHQRAARAIMTAGNRKWNWSVMKSDNLEMVVEDELWTLPKYRELLFIR